MSPRTRVRIVSTVLVALIAMPIVGRFTNRPATPPLSDFAREVDLTPLAKIAVHSEGRLKSYGSFAHQMIGFVSGHHKVNGLPDEFAYLDLMIRPDRYVDADIILIKQKPMRTQIARVLEDEPTVTPDRRAHFLRTGLISEPLLRTPSVSALLDAWSRDLIRTAKHVDRINGALSIRRPDVLVQQLRIIPPPIGDDKVPWLTFGDFFAGGSGGGAASSLANRYEANTILKLRGLWSDLMRGWKADDAQAVNKAIAGIGELLPTLRPDLYPSVRKLASETWYFNSHGLTWVWLIYLLSVIFLLCSVAYKWDSARHLGMAIFIAAFALHTFALGLRWYVSGRWPNSNMFEAVTTAVWFGAALSIFLEVFVRRTPMRNLFALCGGAASMFAMMAANFLPQLDPNINNRMPILYDIWLYIHTNVIIASYALIAMAAVTATLYLLYRLGGGTADYARVGGAASLIDASRRGLNTRERTVTRGEVFDGATMILMELAFILLWAGLIMGAIWADHSWGRPWGWDPKEVFALNTFLVFLVLVHVRLKVRDKGMWTAVLAIIGCAVMLFNWIVINFVISGLHSYA